MSSPGRAGSAFQGRRGKSAPAQTLKVAANQAWFEYQPARVTKPSGPVARPLRSAAGRATRRSTDFDEQGSGPGAEQSRRDRQPDRLSRPALGPPPRSHHHRSAQLPDAGSADARAEARPRQPARRPRSFLPGGDAGDSRRRPRLREGNPPDTIPFARRADRQLPQRRGASTILGAEQKRLVPRSAARRRARPGRSGAIRWHAGLARRSAEPA